MIVKKLSETAIMKNAHNVDARNLYSSIDAMISVITLNPGQSLKRHITPVDVEFYVIEGKGVVEIGEKQQEVGANTLVESPKDIMHCWHNKGTETLRFLVIKNPRPTSKTIILETE